MKGSFDQSGIVARAERRAVLAILTTLSAVACGDTPSDTAAAAAAGTSGQAGSSAAGAFGASQGGAGGSAGSVASAGQGGAGGSAGSAGAAGSTGGAACGDQTCGANQYCRAPCNGTGFGGSPSFGGGQARGSCAVLPAACQGLPSCECICGPTKGFCTPGAVEVQCGCP